MECRLQAHSGCAVALAVPLGAIAFAIAWPPPAATAAAAELASGKPKEARPKLPPWISCPEEEPPRPPEARRRPRFAAAEGGAGAVAHVVYACNARYLPGALVSILSLARQLRSPELFRIHLLASDAENLTRSVAGLERCIRRKLQDMQQLPGIHRHVFRPVRLEPEKMAMTFRYNPHLINTYPFIRFYLHEYLPTAQRVLWLDSDTILLADVMALFTMGMGHAVAAVQDGIKGTLQAYHDIYAGYSEVQARLRPRLDTPALQSGVLLLDAERWRPGALTRSLEAWTGRLAGGSDADQAVLNVYLRGDFDRLDWRWNLAGAGSPLRISPRCMAEAKVVHFTGGLVRPWEGGPLADPVAARRYCELFGRFGEDCGALQCRFAEG